jgi:hypothetical protein
VLRVEGHAAEKGDDFLLFSALDVLAQRLVDGGLLGGLSADLLRFREQVFVDGEVGRYVELSLRDIKPALIRSPDRVTAPVKVYIIYLLRHSM